MRLLALEAATPTVSLALGEGPRHARRLLAEHTLAQGENASDQLPGAILSLLAQAGLGLDDLSGFAVGTGPGSLTGLRVAQATVKGLAYARRLPVVGVSSLEAMAAEAPAGPELVVPLLDARRNELYAGLFRREAKLEVVEPALALPAEKLAERLLGQGPLRIFGPGEPLARPALEAAGLRWMNEGPSFPRARAVLERAPDPGPFDLQALAALQPQYVRAPEREWTLKPKKPRR